MESNLLEAALKAGDISKSLFQGSASKDLITELQRLLVYVIKGETSSGAPGILAIMEGNVTHTTFQ